ncbi:MAG: sialate O-acetylesterase [Bacteroidetes bacterium]|nr:sialate O-acetylesterase [Bacteroidota bacterium]
MVGRRKGKRLYGAVIILVFCIKATAQLSLPKIIGNDMVLQNGQPVPVWGTAKPGEVISASFHTQSKKTTADQNGNWMLQLDAMPVSATPSELTITSASQKIILHNILVGEVWLCSGQSNMEYSMRKNDKVIVPAGETNWPVNEVATAHNNNIRIFLVDRKKMKPDSTHSGWSVAKDSALRAFSAAGYFFAKKLYEELHVPIGVIESAIPGSRIEPWMPREAFTALPFFRDQTDTIHKIDGEPGKFYSSMIAPLAPFALKGFLWYQGESNCFLGERLQYAYKMKALINQWRNIWHNNALPFYYVQIAPYDYSKQKGQVPYTEQSLPEFWEAQTTALQIPHTAMITTTDLNFDLDNLHPHFKWEIGKRLALCALANNYKKGNEFMGPQYRSMKIAGDHIILYFDHCGKGLMSKDGTPLQNFEIADGKGGYVDANAIIKKNTVDVSAKGITHPEAVRFAWNEGDHANLYNKDGLPAIPFRTDNPLQGKFK